MHFTWNNISGKLLVAIAMWLMCGIAVVALSMNITWKLEDRGVAINDAGSLRKRVYHIAALSNTQQFDRMQEQIEEFQVIIKRLTKESNYYCCFSLGTELVDQAKLVENRFNLLLDELQHTRTEDFNDIEILAHATRLTQDIDTFVKIIENENTYNIQLLRFVQLILIALVLLSALLSFYLLNKLVIYPLSTIKDAIDKITKGELQTRTNIKSKDEFEAVSKGFNAMAENLEDMYLNLEGKVTEKTLALEKQNKNWAILYEVTTHLHEKYSAQEEIDTFLKKIIALSRASGGLIRLVDKKTKSMSVVSSIGVEGTTFLKECQNGSDGFCAESAEKTNITILNEEHQACSSHCLTDQSLKLINFPIQHAGNTLGLLTLYCKEGTNLADDDVDLIGLLCTQFGIAIENMQLMVKEKHLAIMEERNLMAQGLHDSIAQSLSFLNLQVQMLIEAVEQNDSKVVKQNVDFIQQGIQQCYDDVRELLSNFRMRFNKEDFIEMINNVINRYQKQIKIPINLEINDSSLSLQPEQQLQIIFILQEALSNIRKHAKANTINVIINNQNGFSMLVQDDGVGFDMDADKEQSGYHIGLKIMKERASKINANFDIQSAKNKGTRVLLIIPSY